MEASETGSAEASPPPPPSPFEDPPAVKRLRLTVTSSTAFRSSPTLTPTAIPSSPSLTSSSLVSWSEPENIEWWHLESYGLEPPLRRAVDELRQYLKDYNATALDPFWHRKSGKPVLAVVICRGEDGALVSCRGMNTEVSLPAGSLCAERAAIAQAATQFRTSSSILAIAVADPQDKLNPLWPCEVCKSWLTKLRAQSPAIAVLAVASSACEAFTVRINGELQQPPMPPLALQSPVSLDGLLEQVELVEGMAESPWEAQKLIYVDGAWTFLHSAQQSILREARARGTHLLVGVHSDEVLKKEFDGPVFEAFETRIGRILQNRYVCSVLRNAPWCVTSELISALRIDVVVTGSVCKVEDVGGVKGRTADPYKVPHDLGILEVVPSTDETTEWKVHEKSIALSRS